MKKLTEIERRVAEMKRDTTKEPTISNSVQLFGTCYILAHVQMLRYLLSIKVVQIDGNVTEIDGKVAKIYGKVAEINERVAEIYGRVARDLWKSGRDR